jgi:hypothetical protein
MESKSVVMAGTRAQTDSAASGCDDPDPEPQSFPTKRDARKAALVVDALKASLRLWTTKP